MKTEPKTYSLNADFRALLATVWCIGLGRYRLYIVFPDVEMDLLITHTVTYGISQDGPPTPTYHVITTMTTAFARYQAFAVRTSTNSRPAIYTTVSRLIPETSADVKITGVV